MGKKILLIEDELFLREIYERALVQKGYQVDSVADGQAALERLTKTQEYDLILLDIMLPKASGISVLKEIKQELSPAKNIPVYVLTNLGQDSVVQEALALGAKKYLIKSAQLPLQIVAEVDAFFSH